MKQTKSWQKEPLWQVSEPSGGTAEPAVDEPAAAAEPAAEPAAPDTSFLPEGVLKDGAVDFTALKTHLDGLAPKGVAPEAYDFTLPADFKVEGLPEGTTLELDLANPKYAPLLAEVSDALKGIAAPPEVAQKLAGALAKYEAMHILEAKAAEDKKHADLEAVIAEETKSLGPNATERIGTLNRLIESKLPEAQATALKGMTQNAAAVQALETLFSGASFTPPSPTPKTAQDDLAAYYANPKK